MADALWIFWVVAGVTFVLLLFFTSVNAMALHDTASTAKTEITQTFEQVATSDERQQLAASLLALQATDFQTSINDITTDSISSNVIDELERVRETGEVPNVTYEVKGFWYWVSTYGPVVLALYFLAFSAIVFFGFQQTTTERARTYYLMDLPWRKPWPYLLVLVTLPVGFAFYAVSVVRLFIAKLNDQSEEIEREAMRQRIEQEHRLQQQEMAERRRLQRNNIHGRERHIFNEGVDDDDDLEDTYGFFPNRDRRMAQYMTAPSRREPAYQPVTQSMIGSIGSVDAPQAARRKYIAIRTQKSNNQLVGRREDLNMQVERTERNLRSAGQTIQELQRKLSSDKAELKKITHAIEARKNSESGINTTDVEQEFDRILALSGVSSIGLVNDSIVIEVDAVIEHKRKQYDGGTWRIWFSAGDRELHSKEIRSGVSDSWRARYGRGHYPDYLHHGGFCFGGRRNEIDSYIERGQYYEAIQLAVHCMQSVNEDNRSDIPHAFNQLKKTKEVTV